MTNDKASAETTVTVYLGLGSNVGDRQANLRDAVARIKNLGVAVERESSIYETEPVGFKDQSWFLNQVIELHIDRDVPLRDAPPRDTWPAELNSAACELHKALQRIEREMGRERTVPNGPRVIDIDLLMCGDMTGSWGETPGGPNATACAAYLIIPHPRMHLRRFVLEPLCEIGRELTHPVLKKTCGEILASLDDPSVVRRYASTHADS